MAQFEELRSKYEEEAIGYATVSPHPQIFLSSLWRKSDAHALSQSWGEIWIEGEEGNQKVLNCFRYNSLLTVGISNQ